MKGYLVISGLTALLAAPPVLAADDAPERGELEEIVVSGSRMHSDLVSPARQTTIVDQHDFQLQVKAGGTLAEVLAAAVPGLNPPSQTISEYSLRLRGRNFLTIVDGIALLTNRNVNRSLTNINPHTIERIEVVRGGNAIYGSGASGGVISITTLTPTDEHRRQTRFEVTSSMAGGGADSLGYDLNQAFTGTFDTFDYVLSLSYGESGGNFDADGDRIAPEISQGDLFDATTTGLLAKLGKDLDEDRRIQFRASYLDAEQDSDFASDTSVLDMPLRSVDARAIEGLQLADQNDIYNLLLSADYFDQDTALGSLHAQVYYRDHETRFYPFDARAIGSQLHLTQTYLTSELIGGRLTINTPASLFASDDTEVIWGLDWSDEEAAMPVTTYDGAAYDASNGLVFVATGDKIYMPPITHSALAGFAQVRSQLTDVWSLDTGLRYETTDMEFDDFVTLPQTLQPDPVVTPGGQLDYDAWLFNIGLIAEPLDGQEFYVSFNQGFEQPDVGLQVRNAQPGFDINSSQLEAIKSDNYEIGWRGNWSNLSSTFAYYYSTSDLGRVSTVDFGLTLSRSEERIRGMEATVDYTFSEQWAGGLAVSHIDGEEKPDGAVDFRDMDGFRAPPTTLKGHVDWSPAEHWQNRLMFFYVDDGDFRLDGAESFGRRTTESYFVVDLVSRYDIGHGTFHVGIENLFNNDYHTLYGQLLRSSSNQSHIPARGTTLRVGYTYDWGATE